MNNLLFISISLSVSGSILALILLALKPLVRNRLSQTWQYYIWLIVILRFLLPFTPQISVVGEIAQQIENIAHPPATVEINPSVDVNEEYIITQPPDTPQTLQAPQNYNKVETPIHSIYWRDIFNNIWLLWIGVALVLFVHKVASYRSFVRFIKVGIEKITDAHTLVIYRDELKAAKVKRQLPIYVNNQVVSPMLVGIIRPTLVIPILETSDDELRNILRHELTHYKRLDFLYKWVVQITICLHWFNPLVRLISQRINKSCELSCDETVIKHLDEDNRITYGDALIASLKAQGNYSDFVVSMTMSENGNIVKERLDLIMNFHAKSKLTAIFSAVLTIALLCGFTFIGAYKIPTGTTVEKNITKNANDNIAAVEIIKDDRDASSDTLSAISSVRAKNNPTIPNTGDPNAKGTIVININSNGQKSLINSSSFKANAGQTLTLEIKSTISGTVDLFLFSPSYKEHRIAIGGNNDTKTINLSAGTWAYNCTGFFDSGNISIVGIVKDSKKTSSDTSAYISERIFTSEPPIFNNETVSGVGKSTDADKAANHLMKYSGSWIMVEYILPYMTETGIDKVVKLNNEMNPGNQKVASDYYDLTTPSKSESDQCSYNLMNLSGNWTYSSPIFPYMSNDGIDKVIALYNQKTGKSIDATNYHNS